MKQAPPACGELLQPLSHIAEGLSQQVNWLRTMYLHPGETEPVDCTGMDLCGRVREMAYLCQQLHEELEQIQTQINKDHL